MMSMSPIFLALVLGTLQMIVVAEVTVLKQVQTIYDKSPKIRIRGSGFDAEDHDTILEIGANGMPKLVVEKDYLINKDPDNDGIILKLLGGRKWVNLAGHTPPVALILSAVKFASNPSVDLLVEPVIIAQVLSTPSIVTNDDVLYQSASNELRINGTGFIGAKKVDLYFNPPLVKGVAYEDVTPYPLGKNQVVLRLRHDYSWRDSPGPLLVMGVDTGGGPVKVDGDTGAMVAEVASNLDMHSVTVQDTLYSQLVYWDQPTLTIHGSGFNTIGNALRWSNGLLGNNVNYTTLSTAETAITIRLTPTSHWRKNPANLPGALTLLAVNAGAGYVAVGPMNAGKGRDIAMVFETPQVFSNIAKLYRTHSHELHIQGTGFPLLSSGYKPQLRFSPELTEGVHYSLRVVSRTDLEVTLLDGQAWRADVGALVVTAINTRGDEAGWVTMPGAGVHVADVQADVSSSSTGGVEVFPMGVKVYQSALQEVITVTGTGFVEGMKFTLDPPLTEGSQYTVTYKSANQAELHLKSGNKWRANAGLIICKSISINNKAYPLAGSDGIRIAVVLADPVIVPSAAKYHESQSKLIVVEGSGFTDVADTKIVIRPTAPAAYRIIGAMDDALRVQLQPGSDWLPSFMSLKDEDDEKQIPLQVSSIDTGAGEIVYDNPIDIGFIVKDREGVTCDDSCEFAFDGVCDDGSEPNDEYYYQNYFNYMDDDLGGFYGDDFYGRDENVEGEDDLGPYYSYYDDYYMENEDYKVSACVQGTDCTDCGGVDAIIDYNIPPEDSGDSSSSSSGAAVTCTNTCVYPRDGVCDDPRGTQYCALGTDCQDCGPVGAANFTMMDDDGWWDDDDDYWNFNDGNFLEQTDGLEANRHKVKVYKSEEPESAGSMFLIVLEAMVYTVGAIFVLAGLYLFNRWYRGESVPFVNSFNSEVSQREFEMRPQQKMPVTPDEFRT